MCLQFTTTDPRKWKKAQVAEWVEQMCIECELDKQDVARLKELSGAALHRLKRSDWMERSPKQGDVLYNIWSDMITPQQAEKVTLAEGKQ